MLLFDVQITWPIAVFVGKCKYGSVKTLFVFNSFSCVSENVLFCPHYRKLSCKVWKNKNILFFCCRSQAFSIERRVSAASPCMWISTQPWKITTWLFVSLKQDTWAVQAWPKLSSTDLISLKREVTSAKQTVGPSFWDAPGPNLLLFLFKRTCWWPWCWKTCLLPPEGFAQLCGVPCRRPCPNLRWWRTTTLTSSQPALRGFPFCFTVTPFGFKPAGYQCNLNKVDEEGNKCSKSITFKWM